MHLINKKYDDTTWLVRDNDTWSQYDVKTMIDGLIKQFSGLKNEEFKFYLRCD